MKSELILWLIMKVTISSFMTEGVFNGQRKQTVNDFGKWEQNQRLHIYFNYFGNFVSPIYTFSLAWKFIVYRPIHSTNREKYLTILFIKEKCQLWPEMNTSPSISSSIRRKRYGFNMSEMDIRVVIPAPTKNNNINKKSKGFAYEEITTKYNKK